MWTGQMYGQSVTLGITLAFLACLGCLDTVDARKNEMKNHKLYALTSNHQCHARYYHKPECVNKPTGYDCHCGPGFIWNTHSCFAIGLNSYFDFKRTRPVRYTLLLNKPVPTLKAFTIAFWLYTYRSRHLGTVMSYARRQSIGSMDNLRIVTAPTLSFKIHGYVITTNLTLGVAKWTHVVWTWNYRDGAWKVLVDGGKIQFQGHTAANTHRPIRGNGEMVIGQRSKLEDAHYDLTYAFLGRLGLINIWHQPKTKSQIRALYKDCIFRSCGDALEWSDFRRGTRGSLRIRWPSGIFGSGYCFTESQASSECDTYCSSVIGIRCNSETNSLIRWPRTPSDMNSSSPCPGNKSVSAYRYCSRGVDSLHGEWSQANIDNCATYENLQLRKGAKLLEDSKTINGSRLLEYSRHMAVHTRLENFKNPVDITMVIDSVRHIINSQKKILERERKHGGIRIHGIDRRYDKRTFPQLADTQQLSQTLLSTLSHLLQEHNKDGWIGGYPQGSSGTHFLQTLDMLIQLDAESLRFHIRRGDVVVPDVELIISAHLDKIDLKVTMYKSTAMPDSDWFPQEHSSNRHHLADNIDWYMHVPKNALMKKNTSRLPDFILLSTARLEAATVLPNHDIEKQSKEDNVNTPLFSIFSQIDGIPLQTFHHPITIKLPFIDTLNISNPVCITLKEVKNYAWIWTDKYCQLQHSTNTYVVCYCSRPGIHAAYTDMYDVNWDPGLVVVELMNVASYIGCSLAALMCFLVAAILTYLRTSSATTSIHKNFAIAIVCSQLTFMFGINQYHNKYVCRAFAICLHYFFLSTFQWLLNEAFNLYIVITYAAHSHTEQSDGGSLYRYYVLGWVQPGVIVASLVAIYTEDYYASDMCWISWQHLWLFIGPAIGLSVVTLLVLVFTAKEHYESSYSKNETTNNIILIHSKALWTQMILLSLCWSFAFLSIKMHDVIVKLLFALFNILQGSFFLVFYFLLNEEVRSLYRIKLKKTDGEKEEYEYHLNTDFNNDTQTILQNSAPTQSTQV